MRVHLGYRTPGMKKKKQTHLRIDMPSCESACEKTLIINYEQSIYCDVDRTKRIKRFKKVDVKFLFYCCSRK